MEDGYQVFIMDYPLYVILNKTTYEFSFEQQTTFITFQYTGYLIGIPMIGYNKPYNKGEYNLQNQPKQPVFFIAHLTLRFLLGVKCEAHIPTKYTPGHGYPYELRKKNVVFSIIPVV